jgi:flagellin
MGSFSILNNIGAVNAQNQLNTNNVNLSRTLQRLASGERINTGADDPAGLEIADSLQANTQALNQAVQNANNGVAVSQIADGALQEITNLLTTAVTLAEEAATGTVDATGRTALNTEYQSIQAEIARIASTTNYNGNNIFTTGGLNGSLSVFVGDITGSSSISVTISTITADNTNGTVSNLGGANGANGANLASIDLTSIAGASSALTTLKGAINDVATMRGQIGAGINRLQSAVSVLQTESQNTQSAESTIRDANVAQEVSNLTKYQILAQTGMAALAQANTSSQLVLKLLS